MALNSLSFLLSPDFICGSHVLLLFFLLVESCSLFQSLPPFSSSFHPNATLLFLVKCLHQVAQVSCFMCLRPTIFSWEKEDGELPPLAKAEGALLSFSMLNKSDNGVYICHADNGIGKGKGSYTLQVQGKRTKH